MTSPCPPPNPLGMGRVYALDVISVSVPWLLITHATSPPLYLSSIFARGRPGTMTQGYSEANRWSGVRARLCLLAQAGCSTIGDNVPSKRMRTRFVPGPIGSKYHDMPWKEVAPCQDTGPLLACSAKRPVTRSWFRNRAASTSILPAHRYTLN